MPGNSRNVFVMTEHDFFHVPEAFRMAGVPVSRFGATVAIGALSLVALQENGPVYPAVEIAPAHAERPDGFSVINARERQESGLARMSRLLPILKGHFQGRFHRRGTVVGEKKPRQIARSDFRKLRRQEDSRFMGHVGENVMGHFVELPGERSVEARIFRKPSPQNPGGFSFL